MNPLKTPAGDDRAMPEITQWTRAIVLSPGSPGQSGISPTLSAAMSQRDWFPVEQHDPFLAMAELCLRERAQTARAGWGLQRMEHLAIVIIEPQRWPALDAMIQAITRYITLASIWLAEGDELVQVQVQDATPSAAAELVHEAARSQSVAPPEPMVARAPMSHSDQEPNIESQRISREEIDMLLNQHDDTGTELPSGNAPR